MKTIGLLGGMSWESTAEYYRLINSSVASHLGGLHSAKIVLYSVDFAEIEKMQHAQDWNSAAELLIRGARRVEAGGADCLLLCTNTMHKVAEAIAAAITIPFLHIGDATADCILKTHRKKIGLLGTRFTMEQDFYRGRLEKQHGLDVMVPLEADRQIVHRVIYEELCKGIIQEQSRQEFRRILNVMVDQGAAGVILGCTEIGMLLSESDCSVPVFDTTKIHCEAGVQFALKTA